MEPVVKEMYDIDLVETYKNMQNLLPNVSYSDKFKPQGEYLYNVLSPIKNYCKKNKIQLDVVLSHNYPIIIDSTYNKYQQYLGLALIAYDVNRIHGLLSYQWKIWKRPGSFLNFVDGLVYRYVIKNSPFDNQIRLDKIMAWVNENRYNEGKDVFLYWNGNKQSLDLLYDQLLKNKLIRVNPYFVQSFKVFNTNSNTLTIWNGTNRQLMWLLYLVYDRKEQYNGTMIHQIAVNLFVNQGKQLNTNNLGTTLRQVKKEIEDGLPKSDGIILIESIYNSIL